MLEDFHVLLVVRWLEVNITSLLCWPFVPKFAGSIPTETVGYLRAKKSSARLPSEGK